MDFSRALMIILMTAVGCGSPVLDLSSETSAQTVTKQSSIQQIRQFEAGPHDTVAVLAGRDVLETMVDQADDRGIWLRFGQDLTGHTKLVFNLVKHHDGFDQVLPCPPFCVAAPAPPGVIANPDHGTTGMDPTSIGRAISRDEASTLTSAFRATYTGVMGQRFETADLSRLLADDRVRGAWFYFGRDDRGDRTILAFPADARSELISASSGQLLSAEPLDAVIGVTGRETCTAATCEAL